VHLVMQPLNAHSQRYEIWQAGQNKRKLDAGNEKDPHMGPLGVSTGCASFLENVKVHLVRQPLNAQSKQNETWQAGQD
jgi:hypothetical protein